MKLLFDDALCEEVVECEVEARALAGDLGPNRQFRQAADAIYRTVPLRKRQIAFLALYQKTLAMLGYPGRLEALVREMEPHGLLPASGVFIRTFNGEEEGAQLSEESDMLGIRVRAETLRDEAACAFLLRHELTHIQDILDPGFQYDPDSPLSVDAPAEESLLRDRYRTLWDLSVDGRLELRGHLPAGMRERRAAEFCALFPGLEETAAARIFTTLWSGPRPADPAFRQMVKGAAELGGSLGLSPAESAGAVPPARRPVGAPCPLCRFTTFEWAETSAELTEAVRAEYPKWKPSHGLCTQCANRYLLGALFAPAPRSDNRILLAISPTGGSCR